MSGGYDHFLLHFGDLSYGEGDVSDWDHWATQVEPYASRVPYLVSFGNHEYNYVHGKWKDQTLLPMRRPAQPRRGDTTGVGHRDDGGSFAPAGGDYGSDSNGECGIAMVHRFRAPSNGRPNRQGSLAWYSFDYGAVHVVQMSSEHDWTEGSDQHAWLEADLTAAAGNRIRTPWIVVTAHRMMYSTQVRAQATPSQKQRSVNFACACGWVGVRERGYLEVRVASGGDDPACAGRLMRAVHWCIARIAARRPFVPSLWQTQLCEEPDYDTSLIFRRHVEPLLLKYKVNVVMVGHQHSYERSCAVRNGTCIDAASAEGAILPSRGAVDHEQPHGVVHITAGSAGAGVEHCGFDTTGAHGNFSRVQSNQWGYLRGRATRSRFTVEFVSDALGTVWDQVALVKV